MFVSLACCGFPVMRHVDRPINVRRWACTLHKRQAGSACKPVSWRLGGVVSSRVSLARVCFPHSRYSYIFLRRPWIRIWCLTKFCPLPRKTESSSRPQPSLRAVRGITILLALTSIPSRSQYPMSRPPVTRILRTPLDPALQTMLLIVVPCRATISLPWMKMT